MPYLGKHRVDGILRLFAKRVNDVCLDSELLGAAARAALLEVTQRREHRFGAELLVAGSLVAGVESDAYVERVGASIELIQLALSLSASGAAPATDEPALAMPLLRALGCPHASGVVDCVGARLLLKALEELMAPSEFVDSARCALPVVQAWQGVFRHRFDARGEQAKARRGDPHGRVACLVGRLLVGMSLAGPSPQALRATTWAQHLSLAFDALRDLQLLAGWSDDTRVDGYLLFQRGHAALPLSILSHIARGEDRATLATLLARPQLEYSDRRAIDQLLSSYAVLEIVRRLARRRLVSAMRLSSALPLPLRSAFRAIELNVSSDLNESQERLTSCIPPRVNRTQDDSDPESAAWPAQKEKNRVNAWSTLEACDRPTGLGPHQAGQRWQQ